MPLVPGLVPFYSDIAKSHVESEFEKYRIIQDRLFESDFDKALKQIEKQVKDKS